MRCKKFGSIMGRDGVIDAGVKAQLIKCCDSIEDCQELHKYTAELWRHHFWAWRQFACLFFMKIADLSCHVMVIHPKWIQVSKRVGLSEEYLVAKLRHIFSHNVHDSCLFYTTTCNLNINIIIIFKVL